MRQYRKAAGLTQEELAERAGLSERAISDLERGARTRPWRDTITLLATALQLGNDELDSLEQAVARSRRTPEAVNSQPSMGHLPSGMAPLLGREREEAAIVHLLRLDEVRLLTLTGTGGVGKTRLALRVASAEASAYAGGARFASLAPVRDPGHVASAITNALGLQEARGTTSRQTLQNVLRGRQLLLLLDNFEHVLDASPLVADLLASCPQLTVLITSREPLHLPGEQEFPVPPLATPPRIEGPVSADYLARYPASALFLARARAVNPELGVNDAQAAAMRPDLPPARWLAACYRIGGGTAQIRIAATTSASPAAAIRSAGRRVERCTGPPADDARLHRLEF